MLLMIKKGAFPTVKEVKKTVQRKICKTKMSMELGA